MVMRRGDKPLLSPGSYDAPGKPASAAHARRLFLRCVERRCPAVLKDLQRSGEGDLGQWAARWHLPDAWVLATATATLEQWRRTPPSRLRWHFDGGEFFPEPNPEPPWALPAPDAQTEDVRAYGARVRAVAVRRWAAHVHAAVV